MGQDGYMMSWWLAADADSKTGAIGPGLLAFLIVAALGVATYLLIRSMLNQMKKVPPSFDSEDDSPDENPGAQSSSGSQPDD